MKKKIFILSLVLNFILLSILIFDLYIEKYEKKMYNHFNFNRYKLDNNLLKMSTDSSLTHKIVFIGNSITANWINLNPSFFYNNQFINRGIGGQTSTQILLRFQQDVVNIDADVVVLNTGINDIGEGDGFYDVNFTINNIKSIIDICQSNDIKLILTTVLPATEIKKNRWSRVGDVQSKIEELNKKIDSLSNKYQLKLIDYNSKLRNIDGTFNKNYTFDGLHPSIEGYIIMEKLVLENIN